MLPGQPFLASYIWDAHWRHLKNTTEASMCAGDAALCQITLTTCSGFSVDYFVLVLFTFVVLGLVSSVLIQGIDCEERIRNDLFCVEWDVKP